MKRLFPLHYIFTGDIESVIEGGGGDALDTDKLSGGAKINRIFYERFPFELVKLAYDEKQLRKEIGFAIRNIHGIRSGLFTPDIAFEAIVKKQIEALKVPAVKCVDMVMTELTNIIKKCTEKMSKYPLLQEEVEKITLGQSRVSEQKAKDQVKMLIEIELSYINTQHPDFIGFAEAQSRASGAGNQQRKQVGNQVIRKGWLMLGGGSFMKGSKDYWFVLTAENLSWYKDESEKEVKYTLRLDGLKLKDVDSGFLSQRVYFSIFNPDQRNLFQNYKELVLSAETEETVDSWKASFLRAGVYPERDKSLDSEINNSELGEMDPIMERQVETIRNLVDSYMKIISKGIQDLVPKICMFMVVNSTKEFVASELLAHLYSQGNTNDLMHESDAEVQRRNEMLRIYQASKEALKIIGDISATTVQTSLPPPVDTADDTDYDIINAAQPQSRPPPAARPGSFHPSPSMNRPGMPSRPNPPPPHKPAEVPRRPAPNRPAPSLPSRPPPVPSRP